jgi:hypothetical protein
MNEHEPLSEHIGDIVWFRQHIKEEMGNNEHAKHINFDELDERDMTLYDLYQAGILKLEQIQEASNDAQQWGERSSGLFRGWLANKLGSQIMKQEMAARKIQS